MFGLSETTINKINDVLASYSSIEQAILYGSRAKGSFRTGSDIDLTLKGDGLNFSTVQKIETDLDDLFLPYKIDLSIFTDITNPDLVDHINRVGVVFYRKKPASPVIS